MSIKPRILWLAIFLASALLVVSSVVLTEWLNLNPCYLCIFQRLLFVVLAAMAALAAMLRAGGLFRRLLVMAFAAIAAGGAAAAGYQTWLQAQVAGSVSCVGGDPNLIERLVNWLSETVPALFEVTGFCEDEALVILHLSLANWALISFVVFLLAAIWDLWTQRRSRD